MKCAMCGTDHFLQRHHVIPLSKGGGKGFTNTIFVCVRCHRKIHGKGVGNPREKINELKWQCRKFTIPRRRLTRSLYVSDKTLGLLNSIRGGDTYDEVIYRLLKPTVDKIITHLCNVFTAEAGAGRNRDPSGGAG